MGGYPSSMKNVPKDINENQTIKMTYRDKEYFFHKRPYTKMYKNTVTRDFTPTVLLEDSVGLNWLANMNQTKVSRYYVTYNDNVPIYSTVNASSLKVYIRLFALEKGISLKDAVFTNFSSFGKRKKLNQIFKDIKKLKNKS